MLPGITEACEKLHGPFKVTLQCRPGHVGAGPDVLGGLGAHQRELLRAAWALKPARMAHKQRRV